MMALSCCSHLATALPHVPLSFPNTTAYNATLSSYWSYQEGSLHPGCIAKPTSSHEVASIISTIVSPKKNCHFAIKSQGHAPAAGFANIDNPDGITIDLSGLDSVEASHDENVASVGAGASWLDVYAALDPLGKTVAGGRNGQVGVGGLTLGGGISYFSPQVGFTCDTVSNFEIVLASGSLVNANSTSHPDLFKALKGGTNNFGVVTKIGFKTLPITKILAGSISNEFGYRKRVDKAFVNIAGAKNYDPHASLVMSWGFNPTTSNWTVSTTPIYTQSVLHPAVYSELFAIPNITNTMHITDLHTFANESAIPQLNFLFYTGTYGVSEKLLDRLFDIANSTLSGFVIKGDSLSWSLTFEPLPTVFVEKGKGKNVLGTSGKDGNGIVLLLSGYWQKPTSSTRIHKKAKELMAKMAKEAKKMGMLHDFVYANYADASQKPFSSYGKQNEAFLRRVARKYDPKGVFQKLVPGGFKLDM